LLYLLCFSPLLFSLDHNLRFLLVFLICVNLETNTSFSYSRAIDINRNLLWRYRELSHSSNSSSSFISRFQISPQSSSPPLSPLVLEPPRMNSFIKITPFNGANSDLSERVEEYLDDIETAALSWELSITPGVKDATDRSKIRLFRQNLERNGDAYHWWYYVLPEGDKKDYGKIVREFKERYGIKASQASSLFAVHNEMLSLAQGEGEHIRDYVHQVEKLSWKIPKEMDSLFAIAFVKGMRDQERRQRVTFDLKDTPNFAFLKALPVVKFSYQEIGEPDPFRPSQQTLEAVEPSVSL